MIWHFNLLSQRRYKLNKKKSILAGLIDSHLLIEFVSGLPNTMRKYPFNFDSSSINFESSHLLLNILQIGVLGELMHVCVGLEAWVVSQVNRHDVIMGGHS